MSTTTTLPPVAEFRAAVAQLLADAHYLSARAAAAMVDDVAARGRESPFFAEVHPVVVEVVKVTFGEPFEEFAARVRAVWAVVRPVADALARPGGGSRP